MRNEQRGREYRRYVRNKTILRKKRIIHLIYVFDWYNHDGKYANGKIHCGCGLCKYGRKYRLPTIKDMREESRIYSLMALYGAD